LSQLYFSFSFLFRVLMELLKFLSELGYMVHKLYGRRMRDVKIR
jgi:hypothetical protein